MKRISFIFLVFVSFMSALSLSAQETETESNSKETNAQEAGSDSAEAFEIIPNLEAEEISDINSFQTKVTFKTNVKNARIYLNGNFQGYSKLILTNLVEGFYLLRAEKDNYDYQEKFIFAERGKSKTFYIELSESKKENAAAESGEASEAESEGESTTSSEETIGEIK